MSDETIQSTEQQTEQPAQPQGPSLQLSDLVLALQTIQAAAQRGAVRADVTVAQIIGVDDDNVRVGWGGSRQAEADQGE